MSKIKPATMSQEGQIKIALLKLTRARDLLIAAGASKRCVDRVRLAISSVKGAKRHVQHRLMRTET